jgi:ferrous iron transport protein B
VKKRPQVLIVGNPNVGKSLLFNRLTGLKHKVANFPGVTVEVLSGAGEGNLSHIDFVDYPGLYSFRSMSRDEEVAIDNLRAALASERFDLALCVVDSTRLERGLSLALHLKKILAASGTRLILVANMIDEVIRSRELLDAEGLSREMGLPVIPLSARQGAGFDRLREALVSGIESHSHLPPIEAAGVQQEYFQFHPEIAQEAAQLSKKFGPRSDVILKSHNRLDRVFLSGTWGGLIFAATMILLFQAIFSWSAPLMDGLENLVKVTGSQVSQWFPAGTGQDFIRDALFGGVGSFLVFVPQIFILFIIIGFLEDSGYLARAAIISHRPLSFFGLSGRSFVPMLSGFACAIPAIMASRAVDSPKKRFLTIFIIPLMTCSARLPVYGLLIAALVPARTALGGLIGLQGLVFFFLYIFGLLLALVVSGFLSRTTAKGMSDSPFVIELPPYRWPAVRPILVNAIGKAYSFVKKAGGVIFAVTVLIWILGYFPGGEGHLDTSYLGRLGRWIEPVVRPMGLDWKFGVAILTSFLAREVFVGTLGTLYGIQSAEEHVSSIIESLRNSGLTLASAMALLVFYAVALQCASTVAVIRKETQSTRTAIGAFVFYSLLAYTLGVITFKIFS